MVLEYMESLTCMVLVCMELVLACMDRFCMVQLSRSLERMVVVEVMECNLGDLGYHHHRRRVILSFSSSKLRNGLAILCYKAS